MAQIAAPQELASEASAKGRGGMSQALLPYDDSDVLSTVRALAKPWEFQCDHDEGREAVGIPQLPESQQQVQSPYDEDKLIDLWALSLEGEMATGPLAFVESLWFQSIVGVVIFMNAIIIGLETDYHSPNWVWVEQSLLIFFVMELSLRLAHVGSDSFVKQPGNLFDLLIVTSGVFDMWFVPIYDLMTGGQRHGRSAFMSTIQMLRLLRIIRLVRLVKIVKPLYRLALGIAEALQGMFWVLIFLIMMLYATAIVLTRLLGHGLVLSEEEALTAWGVSNAPPSSAHEVKALFNSVPSSMFVLFESMSCWSLVQFTPIFMHMPILKAMAVCFYIFSVWALLAVMTGVVSEKMIAVREALNFEETKNKEKSDKAGTAALRELFEKADVDGSGEISKEEFTAMLMWTDLTKQLSQLSSVNAADLEDLFDWLDQDKDGVVAIDEFINGFVSLKDSISAKNFLKLQEDLAKEMRALQVRLKKHANERFDSLIIAVSQPLRKIHAVTEQIQRLEIQLCARGGSEGTIRNDLQASGPANRKALHEMEERIGNRISELLLRVETLAQLQKEGLVTLADD